MPTPKARDSQAEGYEAGLRRSQPQIGTIVKGIVEQDERVMIPTPRAKEPGSTSNGYAKKDIELLRSPTASQGQGGALGEEEARKRGNTVGIRDQAMDLAKLQGHKVSRQTANLPTPTASDIFTNTLTSTQQKEGSLHSVSLAQIVHRPDLFPTPTTRDHKDGQQPHERNGVIQTDTVARAIINSGQVLLPTTRGQNGEDRNNKIWERPIGKPQNLENALYHAITNWGKFEPAIRRWEKILGRPAPAPTKPDGKDGAHRLSSKFTEWMMGLPDGWITSHGLTRNEELKLAGNGVVPQQAELALKLLLGR